MGKGTAIVHALVLGGFAAYLTFAFTNPLGQSWGMKDYLFVLAVIAAVYYNRLSTMQYEKLIQEEHRKKRQNGAYETYYSQYERSSCVC